MPNVVRHENKITQDRVRKLFDYNKNGELIRKTNISGKALIGAVAGSINKSDGYRYVGVDNSEYSAHRIVWLWHYGYMPENNIDHIDRNKLNNRIENLREASKQCNARNSWNRTDNKSGVKGVSWYKRIGKWQAYINVMNKKYGLGCYDDFVEAVFARLAAEQCLSWSGCDSNSPAFCYLKENQLIKVAA